MQFVPVAGEIEPVHQVLDIEGGKAQGHRFQSGVYGIDASGCAWKLTWKSYAVQRDRAGALSIAYNAARTEPNDNSRESPVVGNHRVDNGRCGTPENIPLCAVNLRSGGTILKKLMSFAYSAAIAAGLVGWGSQASFADHWHRHHYNHHYHGGGDVGAAIAGGLIGGAIIGAMTAPRPAPVYEYGDAHVQWCYNRYRSYRAYDNTFQPLRGPRQRCYSPYD
jgi:hypothetical protein